MRIFIAINPSDDERRRLDTAVAPLRTSSFPVRWVAPQNVHLTMKFLGEVEEGRLGELSAAVDAAVADARAFEMAVAGIGAFPSLRRPQVVWLGAERRRELAELQDRVVAEMEGLGFDRERRPFKPHFTLGRAKRGARSDRFRGLEDLAAGIGYEDTYRAKAVDVMQSHLMPSGAVYELLHSAALGR